jgi:hypothetical protein
MGASAQEWTVRTRAQRFKLGGRLRKFRNHLTIALPDVKQIVV